MLKLLKRIAKALLIRSFPKKMGYEIKPRGLGYFSAKTIVKEATASGLSVGDYLEQNNTGGVGRKRADVMLALQQSGVLQKVNTILEIGAGTGMYVEQFIKHCQPKHYHIYETNTGWAQYINATYAGQTHLQVHAADGYSLHQTESNSVDLLTAHGVFVYLPVVITLQYLMEAVRVCRQGGKMVFDCFTDKVFTVEEIIRFREVNPYYDFPVITTEKLVQDFCRFAGLQLLHSFNMPYHQTQSTYFILEKL